MNISRPLSPPSDVESMRKELQALSRKDLQSLAKMEGVKANMSSAVIIEELLRFASAAPGPVQPVKDVVPVVRAPAPAALTTPQTNGSQPKPKSSAVQTAIIGKPAVFTSKPSTSSTSTNTGLSRADTGSAADRDQTAAGPPAVAATKLQQQPSAARTPADVASTSASAARSSTRGKKWEVPAITGSHEAGEQQLQQQIEQLRLSPTKDVTVTHVGAAPAAVGVSIAAAAAAQMPSHVAGQLRHGPAQQHTSHTGMSASTSSKPTVKQVVCHQNQLQRPQLSKVQADNVPQVQKQQLQQHQHQQAHGAPLQTPGGHILHTPMRVRMQDSTTAASKAPAAAAVPRLDLQRGSRSTAAVTPTKQRVQAFGVEADVPPAPTATPGRGSLAAAGGAAATIGVPVGLMSPRLAVMGSARRIMPTQSRVAPSAVAAAAGTRPPAAAAAIAGSANPDLRTTAAQTAAAAAGPPPTPLQKGARRAVPTAGAADADQGTREPYCRPLSAETAATAAAGGPPPTPLQKGARRAVPADAEQHVQDEDRKLETLVERCLRIRNPDAPQTVLQGSEPAKRWLQQHIITPLARATPAAAPAAAGSACGSAASSCPAAGFCHRALLLYGPSGSGKTELVHALASEIGANLLYVPAGDLLKSYQEQGQRLLRALFKVARRASPAVICFDDAHRSFPADARMSYPNHSSHKMLVELTVQLQQLADMQAQLQERLQHGINNSSSSASSVQQQTQGKAKKPAWGIFSSSKHKQQDASEVQQQQPEKPQMPAYQQLPGPVVVVFATRHPEALDPALLPLLPTRLLLDMPCPDTREDILMAWLMAKDAAVGVQDVEQLARHTEGFSCTDLMQLCHEAAMRPVQERSHRAVCIRDFEAAFQKVKPSVSPQRRMQLKAWTGGS